MAFSEKMRSLSSGSGGEARNRQDAMIDAFRKVGVPDHHISVINEHVRVSNLSLVETIRELGFPDSEVVAQAMSIAFNKDYINSLQIDGLSEGDFVSFDGVSRYAARKKCPVGYDEEKNVLRIAVSEYSQLNEINRDYQGIEQFLPGVRLETVFASQETIENTYLRVFSRTKEEVMGFLNTFRQEDVNSQTRTPSLFLNSLLKHACYSGVSDIHFNPTGSTAMIKFRVDGDLFEFCALTKDQFLKIITLIKDNGQISGRIDQTREASYSVPEDMREVSERYRFRVQVSETVRGDAAVFRILDSRSSTASIDAIGFDERTRDDLVDLTEKSAGLVLITGPTGSGKTTTLYSLLKRIDPLQTALHTVENPVEYRYGAWNQHEIDRKSGANQITEGEKWQKFFRGLLRNDIDVGLLGEVRDKSTAEAALQLSNTGHLVWTTLHTNSASRAITRLSEMGVNMGAFADVALAIMAQRLLKKLCPHCKEELSGDEAEKTVKEIVSTVNESVDKMTEVEKDEWKKKLNVSTLDEGVTEDDVRNGVKMFGEVGCSHCGETGYKGRKAVYELLKIDKDIRRAISSKATGDEVMEKVPLTKRMWGVGISHIIDGTASLRELRRRVNKED